MSTAENWLRSRVGKVPPSLLECMVKALPQEASGTPEALVDGALHLYDQVVRGSGGREDALPLLAADALFTHAFEAQATFAPDQIDDLVARCERRLGELLP
ncbi:MAG TPA: hypothetical protein VF167_12380 [Longimicrobiaceae bacterium]